MNLKTTYHRDGTVTYWSVYEEMWLNHADDVPDQELAAMSSEERAKVLSHLGNAGSECPRCGETLSAHYVEHTNITDCPRCGLADHPAFEEFWCEDCDLVWSRKELKELK